MKRAAIIFAVSLVLLILAGVALAMAWCWPQPGRYTLEFREGRPVIFDTARGQWHIMTDKGMQASSEVWAP